MFRDERAYTMIEFIISIALVSLLSIAFYSVYYFMHLSYEKHQILSDLQYSARMGMDMISKDVKTASQVQILEAGKKLKIINSKDQIISYYMENKQLYRHGKSKVPIAENITGFEVLETGETTWEVIITCSYREETYILDRIMASRINVSVNSK